MTQNNTPLTWNQIPDAVKGFVMIYCPSRSDWIECANDLMIAMKPELEKAYHAGVQDFAEQFLTDRETDFETWYNKTYNK